MGDPLGLVERASEGIADDAGGHGDGVLHVAGRHRQGQDRPIRLEVLQHRPVVCTRLKVLHKQLCVYFSKGLVVLEGVMGLEEEGCW